MVATVEAGNRRPPIDPDDASASNGSTGSTGQTPAKDRVKQWLIRAVDASGSSHGALLEAASTREWTVPAGLPQSRVSFAM
jgi:hypothetical protein